MSLKEYERVRRMTIRNDWTVFIFFDVAICCVGAYAMLVIGILPGIAILFSLLAILSEAEYQSLIDRREYLRKVKMRKAW